MSDVLEYAPRRPAARSHWAIILFVGCCMLGLIDASMVAAILFEPGPRSRAAAKPIICSSNLRQIGLALKMYAGTNPKNPAYPPSWREVLLAGDITSDVFVCPSSTVETRAIAPTTQQIAVDVANPAKNHCSYVYVGNGLREDTADPDDVLAYELHADHGQFGVNVLFADGHVDHQWAAPNTPGYLIHQHLLADTAAGVRPIRIRP